MRTRAWLGILGLFATCLSGELRAQVATQPSATEPMLEHADPVASYTMTATLDPVAHTLHGKGTIVWKNASSAPVSELWFHLYLNAFKNQSSVFMRAPIGGFRGNVIPEAWGAIDVKSLIVRTADVAKEGPWDLGGALEKGKHVGRETDDETESRVALPRPLEPGEVVTLEVEWDDKLPAIVERTGYHGSFHMLGQWFPKIARLEDDGKWAHFPFHHLGEFYADYGKYDVTIDVPSGFTVGATGPAVESKDENGRHVERHVQDDIHDFAFTAWDKFDVRKEKIEGVDVTVLTPPHYEDHAERELETMRFSLPHFNARYGKYPYSVLTLVHPPAGAPEAGGMEYPTLITTGQPSWIPRGIYPIEGVTIHEYGHQYFYGLVASNEDSWPFLDEGLNSYAENEGMRAFKGPGSGVNFLGLEVGDVEAQAESSRRHGHDDRVAQGAADYATGATYGALVYGRTATILDTLARVYGKEKMDHAMGVYARRYRFKHPTPEDFLKTMETELGTKAAQNLRLALFEKGWVDYAVTAINSHPSYGAAGMFDKEGKRETLTRDQTKLSNRYDGWVLVVRRGTLKFPVHVKLMTDNGPTDVLWDAEDDWKRIPYSGPTPLRSVVIDDEEAVLLDENRLNNFTTAPDAPKAGAPRVLERGMFWAESILGGLVP